MAHGALAYSVLTTMGSSRDFLSRRLLLGSGDSLGGNTVSRGKLYKRASFLQSFSVRTVASYVLSEYNLPFLRVYRRVNQAWSVLG